MHPMYPHTIITPVQTETYSVKKVAQKLKCSERHVNRLILGGAFGTVSDVSKPGNLCRLFRISKRAFEDFLNRNQLH